MGCVFSHQQEDINQDENVDNLEPFLNDVYEKECVIEAAPEEISFIQEGIETLVEKIVAMYLQPISKNVFLISEGMTPNVVLPNDISVDTTDVKSKILKVGSFYERTKNKFPDEFDFIFLIGCCEQWGHYLTARDHIFFLDADTFNSCLVQYNNFLQYISLDKKIMFHKFEKVHGPAYMLIFKYENGSGAIIDIKADLVPAYSFNVGDAFKWFVNERVNPESFRKEVLKTDKYLGVRYHRSVTETEVHFMRNILSAKHVKVYRVLKYLINGHDNGEFLREKYKTGYSSYEIKTMMIYHHEECEDPDTDKLGGCVIKILRSIYKHSRNYTLPKLINPLDRPNIDKEFLDILNSMTQILIALQSKEQAYTDYESIKIISISEQYRNEHLSSQRFNVESLPQSLTFYTSLSTL